MSSKTQKKDDKKDEKKDEIRKENEDRSDNGEIKDDSKSKGKGSGSKKDVLIEDRPGPRNEITPKLQNESSPYLRGTETVNDNGPLLSVFGLQEILAKVRETQTRLQMSATEVSPAPPDMQDLINSLRAMSENSAFRVVDRPPVFYNYIASQSDQKVFRINRFYEEISKIGSDVDDSDAKVLMGIVLDRLKYIVDQGSFIIQDVPTYCEVRDEIVKSDCLGADFSVLVDTLRRVSGNYILDRLKSYIITNTEVLQGKTDGFLAALPDPIYKVHDALVAHVIQGQRGEFKASIAWLTRYGEAKMMEFSASLLTDIFCVDTVYVLSHYLPVDPQLIWQVPRSAMSNLMMNAALGIPPGTYIVPNAKIATVTISSRIVTTAPFSQMNSTTPTEAQMQDVRKIYLALMFPNQILLDVKDEPGHNVDPIAQQVSALVGKLMFSYGPNLFNITARTARLLDFACSRFFTMTGEHYRKIHRGVTGEPFDFRIEGVRREFDAVQLRNDPDTGRGYNGFRVEDIKVREGPYPHVRRRICYLGYDPEDVIDERISGVDFNYTNFSIMIQALEDSGRIQEANFLMQMMQHHVVRFAHISQVINRDLLSAFTMPDTMFRALAARIRENQYVSDGPIVLDISYHSIFHAFKMRFLPMDRPEFMIIQPLIESIYASELSIMKYNAQRLRDITTEYLESFPSLKNSDIWRVVTSRVPEPIKTVMQITGQQFYVNVRDMYTWIEQPGFQESLPLLLQRIVWDQITDITNIMFTKEVYACRMIVPEPRIDDLETFRREAVYHTNILRAPPPMRNTVHVTRQVAMQRAAEGKLKSSLRSWIDDGMFVKFGNIIRPVFFSIHHNLPDRSILEALPYMYETDNSAGPIAKYRFKLINSVKAFLMLYNTDDKAMPDEFVNVNPSYCNTSLYIPEFIFEQVEESNALNMIDKNMVSLRKRVRVHDLTQSLVEGSKYALPQFD
uniref:Capping protein n=1 Tax=Kammavanpettai virus TaxID=2282480 RepID=A0A3G1RP38_9REOV|nr:capping protein [Kammavanpettai virus]